MMPFGLVVVVVVVVVVAVVVRGIDDDVVSLSRARLGVGTKMAACKPSCIGVGLSKTIFARPRPRPGSEDNNTAK